MAYYSVLIQKPGFTPGLQGGYSDLRQAVDTLAWRMSYRDGEGWIKERDGAGERIIYTATRGEDGIVHLYDVRPRPVGPRERPSALAG